MSKARVCVDTARKSVCYNGQEGKPQEGAVVSTSKQSHGRVDAHLTTTTNGTLKVFCSSSRRESNISGTLLGGGNHV